MCVNTCQGLADKTFRKCTWPTNNLARLKEKPTTYYHQRGGRDWSCFRGTLLQLLPRFCRQRHRFIACCWSHVLRLVSPQVCPSSLLRNQKANVTTGSPRLIVSTCVNTRWLAPSQTRWTLHFRAGIGQVLLGGSEQSWPPALQSRKRTLSFSTIASRDILIYIFRMALLLYYCSI